MLLRLRVKGFKNLRDVDVRFGPLTCFVGQNGVGKSNLFDAIQFLRLLADHEIPRAAAAVRSPLSGAFGPRDLFFGADAAGEMSFAADMVVPADVVDEFGRAAIPTATFLRYEVAFRYAEAPTPRIELTNEELTNLKLTEAKEIIGFPAKDDFRKAAAGRARRGGKLVSSRTAADGTVEVMLHQDGGSRGRPIPAGKSPRTVVGGTNAAEYPTVLAARREMASWHGLQLEPSAMRAPDPFGGPASVDEHGGHLAATLTRLAASEHTEGTIFAEAANRLAELVPDVERLWVDRDEARQQLSLLAKLRGCTHALGPRSLSDGTLRFLALVTMQLDAASARVLCMEEPENGMHPTRVAKMVELLRDFAVDPSFAPGPDNPLRQVVLNTHSPDVARQLDLDEVLFVDSIDSPGGQCARVRPVSGTWRGNDGAISPHRLAEFLGGSQLGPALRRARSHGQITLPFDLDGAAE